MDFNFNNNTPIYMQIIEYIKTKIICGEYKENEKLPSVRDFSFLLDANPNTIQKALTELENIGLIYTERTNGKFVTSNKKIIAQVREETIKELVEKLHLSMQKLGISKEELIENLEKELRSKK